MLLGREISYVLQQLLLLLLLLPLLNQLLVAVDHGLLLSNAIGRPLITLQDKCYDVGSGLDVTSVTRSPNKILLSQRC